MWGEGGRQPMKKAEPPMKSVKLPPDLHLRFKTQVSSEGLGVQAVVIRLIEDYLKKRGA